MDDGKLELYGYCIGDEFFYYISGSCFLNIRNSDNRDGKVVYVKLRKTMSNLLVYLLENSDKEIIEDTALLESVWDENGLKGSQHRLWQVMDELKKKIRKVGIQEDFIYRVNGSGYVMNKNIIYPLYYVKRNNFKKSQINVSL
ncbi:TPA: winged helix-turn-helix domain-containing protein [Klebsiella quasipneumoniae subsp. similipneumoniae]